MAAPPDLLIARHGEKESEAGPCNFDLRLTPAGALDVAGVAAELRARGLVPARILTSPYPRCVQTAGLFAAALGVPRLCVEPGLCEVQTPAVGQKGLRGPRPAWAPAELALLAQERAPGLLLDEAYSPIVAAEEVHAELGEAGRAESQGRVERLAAALKGGAGGLALLVTHGSIARRLADRLAPRECGTTHGEPPMGSVAVLGGGRLLEQVKPRRG